VLTLNQAVGITFKSRSWPHPNINRFCSLLLMHLLTSMFDLSFDEPDEQGDSSACMIMHCDGVVEYASEVSTLGLLLMEFDDAIRGGDRDCRC